MTGYSTAMRPHDVDERPTLVDSRVLSDLLDLCQRADSGLSIQDPALASALRGARAEIVASIIPEP